MARHRTKKHTVPRAKPKQGPVPTGRAMDRAPKSMVIRVGNEDVGRSVRQLVADMRQVMQPDTAARLKERKKNRLRDFTTMAGPLGVTHFLLFSRSDRGNTNMRLAITPRGPTLCFKVDNYSLAKDILKSQRHPQSSSELHQTPPLLIMNNFMTAAAKDTDTTESKTPAVPKHLESLVTTIFQSLFPPVSPQTMPLSSVKRVLLLNREPPTDEANGAYTITLRHYAITTKSTGVPKPIKRLNAAEKVHKSHRKGKGIPNLGQLEDVADYILDAEAGNYTSASDSEADTDAEVEVLAAQTRKLHYRDKLEKKRRAAEAAGASTGPDVEKRAVKLKEIGPRLRLRLVKIQDGLCDGKVMWHEWIEKSEEEQMELDEIWSNRKKQKESRKKQQRENIEKKRKEKKSTKGEEDDDEDDLDNFDEDMLSDLDQWENARAKGVDAMDEDENEPEEV
ncbi:Brix-domain-containing protein [Microthyrium microscopicum]|uniref:Brix-domain-containing protein n=1 Tax=Microthyrium microscopicum TaxID=703497 RepID=A0A6A6U0I8_9PEZI|nr:Brix-domain-containing protein [Microthyrium microscopicum]